jgi:hypothetical protein
VVVWLAYSSPSPARSAKRSNLPPASRHQFRNGGEIPVGVEDLGMAHVGRQRQHHLVDVGAIGMPAHQAPDGKGVAQVMQADGASWPPRFTQPKLSRSALKTRCACRSLSGCPSRRPRLLIRNGMSARRRTCRARCLAVACQCGDRARVDRQQWRLGELGLPDRQHPTLEVDIGIAQVNASETRRPVEAIRPNRVS